jgi:hypothetical protein
MSATAALLGSPGTPDTTMAQTVVDFVVTLTGNYGSGASHGDTLDLSKLGAASNSVPIAVQLFEASPAGAAPSGNIFRYMPGTTQANGVLNVFTAAGAEYTQGSAYGTPPFGVVSFKLRGRAFYSTFI